eukprot:TRINITY_DN4105_c0_g1_i1.p1 TRINITY_DN4105_c0_g1~~TRINITY_DN4105_c0_g1_i1.p1  ORF type:complete len:451 (+),score=66.70 TRINITY_DN4105_c0_g1_i1:120-1472(+)
MGTIEVTEPLSSQHSILGFIVMLGFLPFGIVIMILSFLKRNDPMYKQRFYPLVLIEHVGSLICIFMLTLNGAFSYPVLECNLVWWNAFLIFPLTSIPVLIRAYVYSFRFYLTKERNNVSTPKLMKYVKVIRPAFMLKAWVISNVFLLALIGVGAIIYSRIPGSDVPSTICPFRDIMFVLDIVIGMLVIILWIMAMVFLWKARDYYKIKEEMVITIVAWVVFLILYGVRLPPPFLSAFFIIVGLEVPFVLHAWLLIRLYRHDVKIEPNMEFESCLESPKLREKFRNFLVYQLCVENLMFWEELQHYKAQPHQSAASALSLYNKYIKEGSMYQVNISSEALRILSGKLVFTYHKNNSSTASVDADPVVEPSLFDACEGEVLSMMKFHSFPLFLQSHSGTSSSSASSATSGGGTSSYNINNSSSSSTNTLHHHDHRHSSGNAADSNKVVISIS